MNNINSLKVIKLSLGCSLAIFIAWLLKLEYSMVAGVIVLLTVKDTKEKLLKAPLERFMVFFYVLFFHIYVLIF